MTDDEIDAELKAAGIDMTPAYARLREMINEARRSKHGSEKAEGLEGVQRTSEATGGGGQGQGGQEDCHRQSEADQETR